jgi:hypothetical protein
VQFTGRQLAIFLKWPLIAFVGTILLFVVVYLEQHLDVGVLSLVFIAYSVLLVGLAGALLIVFLVHVVKRRFAPAIAVLLALSIMVVAIVRAREITEQAFAVIDIIRFSISQDHYLQSVARQRDQVVRFPWGAGGFLGTNFFYTLVYRPDGVPRIESAPTRHGCSVTTTEIRKNFYVEGEVCQ